jgi:uncharacterized protein
MNKITNFLCLSLLLLGATALGMNPSFASSLASYSAKATKDRSRGQVNPAERQLLNAARDGNLEEVERLIREGVSVEVKDKDGRTPLIHAAYYGHEAVCKLLIKNHASLEATHVGQTPLLKAAIFRREKICKLLIDARFASAGEKATIAT